MFRTFTKQFLSILLSVILVTTVARVEAQSQGSGYPGQGAPLSANELQQLVAPVALYPDALVAQVLGAATFPDQIVSANNWLQQNRNLTGTALMQAVNSQPWDPSVKALTQFPSVLNGSSVVSKNGESAYTQHETTARGSEGSIQTSQGGKAIAGTGAYGNAAAAETASGNKYAEANGNAYKNTGSGWQQTSGSSDRGWGQQEKSGASAFSGGGWDSRMASARGTESRGFGGGGGRRR